MTPEELEVAAVMEAIPCSFMDNECDKPASWFMKNGLKRIRPVCSHCKQIFDLGKKKLTGKTKEMFDGLQYVLIEDGLDEYKANPA